MQRGPPPPSILYFRQTLEMVVGCGKDGPAVHAVRASPTKQDPVFALSAFPPGWGPAGVGSVYYHDTISFQYWWWPIPRGHFKRFERISAATAFAFYPDFRAYFTGERAPRDFLASEQEKLDAHFARMAKKGKLDR